MKAIVFIAAAAALVFPARAQTNWTVTSPNDQVKVTLTLRPNVNAQGGELFYRVEQVLDDKRSVVIEDSPLGLLLDGPNPSVVTRPEAYPAATGWGHDFRALQFQAATPEKLVEDSYVLAHGKRRECQSRAQQITLAFQNSGVMARAPFEIDVRAFDDGAAFRYRLPTSGESNATVSAEYTSFALPAGTRIWAAPSDKPSTYAPAYETYYEAGVPAGTPAPLGCGWSFPLLFRTADNRWGLITESGVGPNYCASRLGNNPEHGVYRVAFPNPAEGQGHCDARPSSMLPWEMPWRVIIVGPSLGTIVESTLVTDLSPASRVQDVSWIRPGRVAWSWWSDPPSPQDGAKQKKFVDLAAEMGWEYVLVDANWDLMDNGNIHDVLRYAKKKGVGVLLWYNSGGPHNVVTEKPRDTLTYREVRRYELDLLKKWGVKGIKVDFFQSDKQEIVRLYHGIMEDAAAAHIMVNFHGCTLPRGWERTWPHLMSMEAVRGEECYIFDSRYPERAPVQNTILPFTRNAVGPMDYTPVTFSNNKNPRRTTAAHELALSVLFETGWLHFADKAESYLKLPKEPKEFLKRVPVVWDDTRFVAGEPGEFVVLARRKGSTWYLAGVNGRPTPRDERLQLGAWLGGGEYKLTRISDGANVGTFATDTQPIRAGQSLAVRFPAYGGFVGTIQ